MKRRTFDQCLQILPYGGGIVFFFIIIFILYVRSVPPVIDSVTSPLSGQQQTIRKDLINEMLADMGSTAQFDDLSPEDQEAAIQAFLQAQQQAQQHRQAQNDPFSGGEGTMFAADESTAGMTEDTIEL